MGVLLSTLLTVNRMNNSQEIVILRSCGISIKRISKLPLQKDIILLDFWCKAVYISILTSSCLVSGTVFDHKNQIFITDASVSAI